MTSKCWGYFYAIIYFAIFLLIIKMQALGISIVKGRKRVQAIYFSRLKTIGVKKLKKKKTLSKKSRFGNFLFLTIFEEVLPEWTSRIEASTGLSFPIPGINLPYNRGPYGVYLPCTCRRHQKPYKTIS